MSAELPAKIGPYIIDSLLGEGSQAWVYLGTHEDFGTQRAIKLSKVSENSERFLEQADQLRELNGDNIVPVYDSGLFDDLPWLAMQYMESGTLAEYWETQGRSPTPDEVRQVASRLVSALDWIHEANIIHRDIKPSNILVDENGDAYLGDFGAYADLTDRTSAGTLIGSYQYMAPEVAQDGRAIPESDVYSLGSTLYWLWTQQEPVAFGATPPDWNSVSGDKELIRIISMMREREFHARSSLSDLAEYFAGTKRVPRNFNISGRLVGGVVGLIFLLTLGGGLFLVSSDDSTSSSLLVETTSVATQTTTQAATPSPTATQAATPSPTATQAATPGPTATQAVTPSPTATQAVTPSPTATQEATPSPTATQAATPSPTATQAATPSPTAAPTAIPVPGVPGELRAVKGTNEVRLSWSKPFGTTGTIQSYRIRYSSDGGANWTTITRSGTSTTITSLANGTSYLFQVAAENESGVGSFSQSTAATPGSVPSVPYNLSTLAASNQISLSWSAPSSAGGTITRYQVEYRRAGSWTTATSYGTTKTISGLTNGATYEFRVSAVNASGTGNPSSSVYGVPGAIPSAPRALTATPGNATVFLSWSTPLNPGGTISSYRLEYSSNGGVNWSISTRYSTSAQLFSLTPGMTYLFRVAAVNSFGTGTYSSITSATPAGPPGAPTSLSATAGNGQVSLTWNAPSVTGGTITSYQVEHKSGYSWISSTSYGTTKTITGLTNGTTYQFRVRAVNATGAGNYSSTVTATPAGLPGAPTSLSATAGNGQVSLTWNAPSVTGGTITSYQVEYKSGYSWISSTSYGTTKTIAGLTNGTTYQFRVRAVNATGAGNYSSTVTATPAGLPGAPTGLSATAGNGQVSLTWNAPSVTGGAITSYQVEYKSTGSWTTVTSSGMTKTIAGLTNGTTYQFRVRAVNATGAGSYSSIVTATPAGLPGAPTGLSATAGNGQVSLTWNAPSVTGGAITSYQVEYKSTGSWTTVTSSGMTKTIAGLTNGTSYQFRVRAVNAIGSGSYSSTVTAFPAGLPGAPTSLSATAGNGQVSLTWNAPSVTGGWSITSYQVEYKSTGSWTTVTSSVTNKTVTGLTQGTTYQFRVRAVNAIGSGSYSSTVTGFPAGLPGAPTNLRAVVSLLADDSGQIVLSWNAPSANGSTITQYEIDLSSNSSIAASGASCTSCYSSTSSITITFTPGTSAGGNYDFRVRARNSIGAGPNSQSLTGVSPGASGSGPTNLTAVAGPGTVTLNWSAPNYSNSLIRPVLTGEYEVQYNPTSPTYSGPWSSTPVSGETTTITGLTSYPNYYFRVVAKTSTGNSSYSSVVSASPEAIVSVPQAPQNLTYVLDNSGSYHSQPAVPVILSWAAPQNNGGAPIIDYSLQYSLAANSNATGVTVWEPYRAWEELQNNVSSTTWTTNSAQQCNGVKYRYRVAARNSAGVGQWSSAISGIVPYCELGEPYAFQVDSNQSGYLTLSWFAPPLISPYDWTVQSWRVQYWVPNSNSSWSTSKSTSTTSIGLNLTTGLCYKFRAQAVGAGQTGPWVYDLMTSNGTCVN